MRYSTGFAGALLLAMSMSLVAAEPVRDAGSKVRGEWLGVPARANLNVNANQNYVYRAYSVAPSAPAQVMPAAPAPQLAQSNGAVRSYSYQPAPTAVSGTPAATARVAPYLRADHKILGLYGD